MIQRKSYNAFRDEDLVVRLELTAKQHQQILAAIEAHLERIRGEEAELKEIAKRASAAPENRQLAEQLTQMTTGKARRGRLSHRRVWDEIGKILTSAQREQFNALRGSMPDVVRKVLYLFEERA